MAIRMYGCRGRNLVVMGASLGEQTHIYKPHLTVQMKVALENAVGAGEHVFIFLG